MATKEQEQHAKKRCVEADMEESQRIMGVTNRDHDGKEMMKDVELKASSLTNYEQKCAELEERLSIVMGNYQAVLASRDTVALENIAENARLKSEIETRQHILEELTQKFELVLPKISDFQNYISDKENERKELENMLNDRHRYLIEFEDQLKKMFGENGLYCTVDTLTKKLESERALRMKLETDVNSLRTKVDQSMKTVVSHEEQTQFIACDIAAAHQSQDNQSMDACEIELLVTDVANSAMEENQQYDSTNNGTLQESKMELDSQI